MSNILVINASGQETRVALIEQGTISEYYLERKNEKGIVGNIYKGRVVRVLPGMQAAFVDIGLDKAAFLYVGDIVADPSFPGFSEEMDIQASSVEGDPLEAEELPEPSEDQPVAAPTEAASAPEALAAGASAPDPIPVPVEVLKDGAASEEIALIQTAKAEAAVEIAAAIETPAAAEIAPALEAAPAAEAAPAEPAVAPVAEATAEVIELHADDALEEDEEDDDEDEEELDEADAAHAAAEEQIAAEQAASEPPPPGTAMEAASEGSAGADGEAAKPAVAEAGARGVPAEQRPAAREGRRGRRRGGRGRKRGNPDSPRPAAEQPPAKPGNSERREGRSNFKGDERRNGSGSNGGGEGPKRGNGHSFHKRAQIQDLLKEGDEVLVQVVKDPIGTKGARITCHISLPGRHLVFMPTVDHVGISRRIENEKERRRLRELVDKYRPDGTGFIVRTVAENEPSEKLTADIKFLLGLWNEVGKKRESMKAPACVHPDLDLILRSIRDLFSDEVEKLVIDDRAEYERVVSFVEQVAPELKNQVELYGGEEPIFDEYGIEQELIRASNRKVWLKSGGYIIIDQTEALVAIDVNSGRYVGKKGAGASLEDTITKINCEAAKEIVYQLRLRNIGGIIIIDFIDMDKGQNREKVFKTLQDALAADRAKTNVLKISDIGLVEMTRKRVRESIGRLTTEACPVCDGRGHVRSRATMAYDIMREVQRAAGKHREDQLVISCHPEVAKLLQGPEREAMRLLMMKLNKSITVRPQPQYHVEQYDLHAKWSRPELAPAQRGGGGGGRGRDGGGRGGRGGQQRNEPKPEAQPEAQPEAKVGD
ncbi:MAG TPA: Rne/Rng family ribonuclease [Myxococcales bacterium]|nr:Rne/Rng family ribonuclease [Myxococcales bacterium]